MGTTSIEWVATYGKNGRVVPGATWNPVTGCTEVSAGCDHCYARVFAERWRGLAGHPYEQGFDLRLWPDRLSLPLQWKKPRRIFVNSMSDWLHPAVPDDFILRMFDVMLSARQHTYLLLTKRPSRLKNTSLMQQLMQRCEDRTHRRVWPGHLWLGTTVEHQEYVWRATSLRQAVMQVGIPYEQIILFLSCEPLLCSLTLDLEGFSWVIAGAESGARARPMDENWVRALRDQCLNLHIPFFYKQRLDERGRKVPLPVLDGVVWHEYPSSPTMPM